MGNFSLDLLVGLVFIAVVGATIVWWEAANTAYLRLIKERVNHDVPTPDEATRDLIEGHWRYSQETLEQNWGRLGAMYFRRQDDPLVEAARLKVWRRLPVVFLAFLLSSILFLRVA